MYVANTYGADIRALGALKVVPGKSAIGVDVTYDSSTAAQLAAHILNDTIDGVKLTNTWLHDASPVDFSLDNVVTALKGANLVGSDGVSTFGLNGTGSIVVWAKDDAARNHLDALLQNSVLGWNLTVAVNNPVVTGKHPVVTGKHPEPCWPGGLGRNPSPTITSPTTTPPVSAGPDAP